MLGGVERIVQLADLARVDIAPGFFAITRSPNLREVLAGVLDVGGVVTAALHRSVVIGYAVDLPFVPVPFARRWQSVPDARELGAIEVARAFRGTGVARRLLDEMFRGGRLDGKIVIAEGLCWHWDAEARGLSYAECRAALLALFAGAGLERFHTDETEIAYSPCNFLAARVGPDVPEESRRAFERTLERCEP
jgi:acetoin utilization protein AcuA